MQNPDGIIRNLILNTNEVKIAYENGECPDCGEIIPGNVADGESCTNCGHVFFPYQSCD